MMAVIWKLISEDFFPVGFKNSGYPQLAGLQGNFWIHRGELPDQAPVSFNVKKSVRFLGMNDKPHFAKNKPNQRFRSDEFW